MTQKRRLSGLAAGLLLAYAGKKQLASATGASTTNVDGGGLTTSYWGLRGTEDLGGGLSALFDITGNIRPDSGDYGRFPGDAPFSRSSWVGLQDAWGTLRLGRMSSPHFGVALRINPFADSTSFSPYLLHTYVGGQPLDAAVASGGPSGVSDSGYSNTAMYNSPKLKGFQAAIAYSFGEVAGSTSSNRRISYSANYENGPLLLAYSADRVNRPTLPPPPTVAAGNQKTKQNSDQVGATYDFGVVKLFAAYNRTAIDLPAPATRKFQTSQLGASMPVGQGVIMLAAASTRKTETALIDITRTTWTLGYDYYLSKRTDMYVVLMNDKMTGLQTGNTLVAGLRHRF